MAVSCIGTLLAEVAWPQRDYTGSDRNHDGIGDTPYHETDVYGYIVDRHPEARVFALSPAVTLLRKGEELMPLLDTTGVTDLAPLMSLPAAARVMNARPHPCPLRRTCLAERARPRAQRLQSKWRRSNAP